MEHYKIKSKVDNTQPNLFDKQEFGVTREYLREQLEEKIERDANLQGGSNYWGTVLSTFLVAPIIAARGVFGIVERFSDNETVIIGATSILGTLGGLYMAGLLGNVVYNYTKKHVKSTEEKKIEERIEQIISNNSILTKEEAYNDIWGLYRSRRWRELKTPSPQKEIF